MTTEQTGDETDQGVRIVSVGRLAEHLKKYIERNQHLRLIGVRGEISNFKSASSGIVRFDLKDDDALLNCVVFSKDAQRLPTLANGQAVVATGYISTWEKASRYQLVTSTVRIDGIGELHAAYEELKRKLAAEGLFDDVRKRSIPRYPFRIGLVSSRGAAGAGDFSEIVRKRAPQIAIVWFETPVQNLSAVPEIVAAIDRASRSEVDVIVVARGGGSFEDLFPFSAEGVVRAIARSVVPVVTAVGHHVDFPLCDLVADWRAPTPSAAAAKVAPDRNELLDRLSRDRTQIAARVRYELESYGTRLDRAARLPVFSDAQRMIGPLQQRLDYVQQRFTSAIRSGLHERVARVGVFRERLARRDPGPEIARRRERHAVAAERMRGALTAYLARAQTRLDRLRAVLAAKDPATILKQGYAIVTADERVVRDASSVALGSVIRARLAHGALSARVEALEENG